MEVTFTRTPFHGWQDCYRLGNGVIELVGTTEVGPRLVHLGLVGGRNLFYQQIGNSGRRGGDSWRLYGGHRLWHAPEDARRTYRPDNDPIEVEQRGEAVHVRQPTEAVTGIAKRLELRMSRDAPHVRLIHGLRNEGAWPIELAPWALSVMAGGGRGYAPLPPRGTHPEMLTPANTLTLWPYTDMTDPRWTWGRRFVSLRQDPSATTPQKVGLDVHDGWIAYLLDGTLFLKLFERHPHLPYPDLGSNVELFSNNVMLELETLGPLQTLAVGAEAVHVEDWFVFDGVAADAGAAETFELLTPLLAQARRHLAALAETPGR